jgi:hypothetical protein
VTDADCECVFLQAARRQTHGQHKQRARMWFRSLQRKQRLSRKWLASRKWTVSRKLRKAAHHGQAAQAAVARLLHLQL